MKQSQNGRRGRSRSNARKSGKGQDPNRVEIKVRGNPKQLLEKYKNAARDAMQAGDRVLAEHNLQFADHYQRVLNEMRGLTRGLFSGDYVVVERAERSPDADEEGFDQDTTTDGETEASAAEDQPQQRERRPRRGRRSRDQHSEEGQAASGDTAQPQVNAPAAVQDAPAAEQPTEVHPELDLAGGPETVSEPVKPRRRGRPRRAAVEAEAAAPVPAEGDAA